MKKIIYGFLSLIAVMTVSCKDDDVSVVTSPVARGSVIDDMGNNYEWVRIGNLDWTTSNALNGASMLDVEYLYWGDWENLFDDDDQEELIENYLPVHGNLMTYEEAMASAPDGWRLPSDEDWKNLERALGMSDADNMGWRGAGVASRLMDKAGVGLGLSLGGNIRSIIQNGGDYTVTFDSNGEYGYYWTSTIEPSYTDHHAAYFRKLVYGVDKVERQCTTTQSYYSVRWCRDAKTD